MLRFIDGVSFTAASTGTGSFVYGASRASYRTMAQSQTDGDLSDGDIVPYFAVDSLTGPTQREWGYGTYSAGGNSLTRSVINGTSGKGVTVNFSTAPIVTLGILGEILASLSVPVETSNPSTIFTTNLAAWYKADAGVTVSGSSVTGWADQSGGSHNLTVGAGLTSPNYSSQLFNGEPGITFFKNTNNLQVPSVTLISGTAAAFFMVFRPWYWLQTNPRMLGYYAPPTYLDYNDPTGFAFEPNRTNGLFGIEHNSTSPLDVINPGPGTCVRAGLVFDGTNFSIYVNNNLVGQVALSFTFGASKTLSIGKGGDNGAIFDIFELAVINASPTTTQLANLDAYFSGKWGMH